MNDFNQFEPVAWKRDGENGLVKAPEPPPGVDGVLILDFCNKRDTLLLVNDEDVWLAPPSSGFVNKLEPRAEPEIERSLSKAR